MLASHLKIAFRNLLRHKAFSLLNIAGLALAMSVCLLFIMQIKDAHSYDKFHPDSGQAYRILTTALRKDGGAESYASSPFPAAQALVESCPQVELWTPLVQNFSSEVKVGGERIYFRGMFTDGSFFKMFGFELAQGDPAEALREPYSIVLGEELAEKLFPKTDPLGKLVETPGYGGSFKVTGVLKKFPGKTHLEFEALGSLSTQVALEKTPGASPVTTEWRNYYSTYNFIRLKKGASAKTAEFALAELASTKYKGFELESRDAGYRFELQRLDDITPGRMLSQSMGGGMPMMLVWFMTALGLVIMLCACFNYTNLTLARSLARTKEVGVRKVMGASREQVFGQFVGEAVVASLLALVVAWNALLLAKPLLGSSILAEFSEAADWALLGWFLLFAVAAGVAAGLLPALALSKTSPLLVLQKLQNVRLVRRFGLRKALLAFQFAVTLVFLFLVTIVTRQVNYGMSLNFGINQPRTLLVEMQGVPYGKLAAAFSQTGGVEKVSAISHSMGTWRDSDTDVRSDSVTEKTGVRDYFIDHNYLEHFGIELLAGENFPDNPAQQRELFVLVNETFCRNFKLGEPGEAVGKTLILGDSAQVAVRGVVKDFLFKPSTYAIEPLLLRSDPARLGVMNVELGGGDVPAALAAVERTWKQVEPERPFSSEFFDEAVRHVYHEHLDMASMVGVFGLLGMVIACLGLLGMAVYAVEARAKEVSIRKVMGAGVADVVLLLSKGYAPVLGAAVLVAVPLAWLAGSQVLQEFAQRMPWTAGLFLPGIAVVLLVAGLVVGSQALRAALANPVKALRSE